jgi:hypothetical protein
MDKLQTNEGTPWKSCKELDVHQQKWGYNMFRLTSVLTMVQFVQCGWSRPVLNLKHPPSHRYFVSIVLLVADRRLFYFQSCWLYIYMYLYIYIFAKKSIVRPLSVVLMNQIQKPLMWMGQSTSSHLLLSQIGSVHNYQRRCFVIKRGDVSWLGQGIMDFVVFKGANWCSYYNTYVYILYIDYTCRVYNTYII